MAKDPVPTELPPESTDNTDAELPAPVVVEPSDEVFVVCVWPTSIFRATLADGSMLEIGIHGAAVTKDQARELSALAAKHGVTLKIGTRK